MKLVTIDLETYWSQTHSLTKMNPMTYITHPETEVQSAAIKIEDGDTFVLFGQELYDWLESYDFSDVMLVGHNMSGFDAPVLAFRFGVKPKMWGCTLAMARQCGFAKTVGGSLKRVAALLDLGDKLDLEATNTKGKKLHEFTAEEIELMRTYNCVDTDLCYGIFKKLAPEVGSRGLKLIDMTIRMLVEPRFEVDVPLLEETLEEVKRLAEKSILGVAETLDPILAMLPDDEKLVAGKKILASATKFAKYLESKGVEVPMKPSPSNPDKMIPALAKTDQEFLDLQEHRNEEVAMAAAARLGVKSTILETRLATFLEFARCANGKMPIFLNYYGADTTGRFSGGMAINHQNMPRVNPYEPKLSDALRKSLKAPPGHKVVVADLSGIELRVNHFLWKVDSSIELYQADPDKADLYSAFAAMLYNKHQTEVTKEERQLGKVCLVEGSLVLTDKGLVPIEKVDTSHRVWDGVEWVSHDGPICNGLREVITHEEVTATPDHIVYLQNGETCTLQEAADKNLRLAVTGDGRQAVRLGEVRKRNTNESGPKVQFQRNSSEVSSPVVQTKRRVWDILNAGPRHRFTAEGKLVSNCQLGLGFGSGSTTFEKVAKIMGGIDLNPDESAKVVAQWRAAYPEITYGWKLCHKAIDHIFHGRHGISIDPWGLCFTADGGIKTPKGFIHYPDLRAEEDEDGRSQWVYGQKSRKARIYGPKMVENIVQHLAREVICDMALTVAKRYPIVHTVHDELITIVPQAEAQGALDYMMQVMKSGVDWWPELITSSEGDIGDTYGDAK